MRRRLKRTVQAITPVGIQDAINHRHETFTRLVSALHDMMTFSEIADLLCCSHEFVRLKLVGAYRENPATLVRIGRQYRVPKTTAEKFVVDVFGN